MSAAVPAGPLESAPGGFVPGRSGSAVLAGVLDGVELGAWDRRVAGWLAGLDMAGCPGNGRRPDRLRGADDHVPRQRDRRRTRRQRAAPARRRHQARDRHDLVRPLASRGQGRLRHPHRDVRQGEPAGEDHPGHLAVERLPEHRAAEDQGRQHRQRLHGVPRRAVRQHGQGRPVRGSGAQPFVDGYFAELIKAGQDPAGPRWACPTSWSSTCPSTTRTPSPRPASRPCPRTGTGSSRSARSSRERASSRSRGPAGSRRTRASSSTRWS